MPRKNNILSLPGFSIVKSHGYNPLILECRYWKVPCCVHCSSKHLRKKSSYVREVRHESISYRQPLLSFKAYKFYCHNCRRYFNQPFPGIRKH